MEALNEDNHLNETQKQELNTFKEKVKQAKATSHFWTGEYLEELVRENKNKAWWTLGAAWTEGEKSTAIPRWVQAVKAEFEGTFLDNTVRYDRLEKLIGRLEGSLEHLVTKLGEDETPEKIFIKDLMIH